MEVGLEVKIGIPILLVAIPKKAMDINKLIDQTEVIHGTRPIPEIKIFGG